MIASLFLYLSRGANLGSGLPKYKGHRLYCDGCGEYFRQGDMIAVWKDHVFHYPIAEEAEAGNCAQIWRLKHKRKLLLLEIVIDAEEFELMVYARGETEEEGNVGAMFG